MCVDPQHSAAVYSRLGFVVRKLACAMSVLAAGSQHALAGARWSSAAFLPRKTASCPRPGPAWLRFLFGHVAACRVIAERACKRSCADGACLPSPVCQPCLGIRLVEFSALSALET